MSETPQQTAPTLKNASRRFSRVFTITSEQIEQALMDVESFLDVATAQQRVSEALEQPDQLPSAVGTEPEPIHEVKTEAVLSTLEADKKVATQLGATMLDSKRIIWQDKICFFLGVVNVALLAFWVGRSPSTYYHYWAFKCVTLFTLRYFSYRKRGMHYLMFELCYAANAAGFIHLYLYKTSPIWRKVSFSFMAGPLMWSIVATRNSLVFHDYDKITTLMMHASPAITAWTMRWYPDPDFIKGMSPDLLNDYNNAGWYDLIVYPFFGYLAWVTSYYFLTFVFFKTRLERKGYANMMTLMVHEPAKKRGGKIGGLPGFVLSKPKVLQPLVYLACHGALSLIALIPTKLWWDSFWLHTAALCFALSVGVWNGANFYFKVFAKKYINELEHRATVDEGKKAK